MDDPDLLLAIERVQQHLRGDWIVEECRTSPSLGCASCQAIRIDAALEGLKNALLENEGELPYHNPVGPITDHRGEGE